MIEAIDSQDNATHNGGISDCGLPITAEITNNDAIVAIDSHDDATHNGGISDCSLHITGEITNNGAIVALVIVLCILQRK